MLFSKIVAVLLSLSLTRADDSVSDADRALITNFRATNLSTSIGSTCACTLLSNLFRGKVLSPGSPAYTAETTHFWDLREDLSPKCIFVPASANDVAKGVIVLDVCQSQFAVRGGGHMPVVGAANTDWGILVALSAFQKITLSVDHNSVEAGSALNWHQLYSFLEPYDRIVIGGRLKTIGIAGLTIGGGISYFAAKYGFGMDNVLAYEVVTANGGVVTATARTNSDLFWAMKGGGNNFGIVTKFTFATYKMPNVSTAIQLFTEDTIPAYISAVVNLANYQDQVDTGAGGIFTITSTPSTDTLNALFLGVQAGPTIKPPVFSNFTAIPSAFSSYNVTTLAYWSSTLDTPFQASRNMFGAHVVLADETTLSNMYATFKAATGPLANISGFSAQLVFQAIPKSATTVAKTNGIGNTWGIDNTKAYIFWLITCEWANASDDQIVMNWSTAILEQIHATNIQAGMGTEFIYLNDASDSQKPFATFPEANLARLKRIRHKYDPTLIFCNLNTGGYKLD